MKKAPPPPATCHLTSWSADGFGHQLAAALSCEALALAFPSRYRYSRSRHTRMEHAPVDAAAPSACGGTRESIDAVRAAEERIIEGWEAVSGAADTFDDFDKAMADLRSWLAPQVSM